ncbi:MAG: diversity-generating retroelement protein Avd [bacterium]
MARTEFLVIQRSFDFSCWLLRHTQKFPKSLRFSLAVRIEDRALTVLEAAVSANRRRDKLALLDRADAALETLRVLVRLSHELKVLATNSYEYAAREIDEIGRLLGGWIRQQTRLPG